MADHTLSMLASSKVDPAGASVFFAGEGVESLMQVRAAWGRLFEPGRREKADLLRSCSPPT